MAIYNLGSINTDNVFELDRMPEAGETLSANRFTRGLGGKGANQSVAVAKAGCTAHHIGCVGSDGVWMKSALSAHGVDTKHVSVLEDQPSGQAIIYVDAAGENSIVLHAGANRAITKTHIETSLENGKTGDWLILQNETNNVLFAAQLARSKGMKVAYSAAPFEADAVDELLGFIDMLAVNEIEMRQLSEALPNGSSEISKIDLLVTMGSVGAKYVSPTLPNEVFHNAFEVEAIDTTGAGDTYFGFFVSGLDNDMTVDEAMRQAAAAAALQVTKIGASDAIPDLDTVHSFLAGQ